MVTADECGYGEQAARIADYQIVHTSESVLPFVSERTDPNSHPDGCAPCGKATWWESRTLPDGCHQTRCTECRSTLTFR